MRESRYIDHKGRVLFVSDGISNGAQWFTCYRKPTGTLKRLVSPNLPIRPTKEEAQADLDKYAKAKNLRRVTLCETCIYNYDCLPDSLTADPVWCSGYKEGALE